jgi:hypothetical protein
MGLWAFALSLGLRLTANERQSCTRLSLHQKTLASSFRRIGLKTFIWRSGIFECFPYWAAHVPILRGRILCLARMPFLQLRWPLRRGRFHMFRLLLPIRSEVEKIVQHGQHRIR